MRLLAILLTAAGLANPLVSGDHPDPTVLATGGGVYASATASAWAPLFPIYRGAELGSLKQIGAVLPTAPSWAAGNFFAPELVRAPPGQSGYRAYFSASQTGGGSCVGVASAASPAGPYTDRGRLLCPPGGAIDPSPVIDEGGKPWIGYRQLGAGGGIALQPLSADGLTTAGPPRLLIKADQPWEGGVVEGPTFLHRGGDWYLFYAGGSCCRPPCTYAEGVARAPSLKGPYTKAAAPWLTGGPDLKCPGHGTLITDSGGNTILVHHAYAAGDVSDVRRLMVATPVTFGDDGWPVATQPALSVAPPGGTAPPPRDQLAQAAWSDDFDGTTLTPGWQWLWNRVPTQTVTAGQLRLSCSAPDTAPTFVARQAGADRFVASASVQPVGGATAFVGVHDKGGALRGLDVRRAASGKLEVAPVAVSRARAVQRSPWTATQATRTLLVRASVAPGGFLGLQAAAPGSAYAVLATGAAGTGAPVTRVALGCHGGGHARFATARLTPLPEPPPPAAAPAPPPAR